MKHRKNKLAEYECVCVCVCVCLTVFETETLRLTCCQCCLSFTWNYTALEVNNLSCEISIKHNFVTARLCQ